MAKNKISWTEPWMHKELHPVAVLVVAAVLHKGRLSTLRQQDLGANVTVWGRSAHHRGAQWHVAHGWRVTLHWQRLHPAGR